MLKVLLFIYCFSLFKTSVAQINVVPYPASVKMKTGQFSLSAKTVIFYTKGAEKIADYLKDELRTNYSLTLQSKLRGVAKQPASNFIELSLRPKPTGHMTAYELDVDNNGVYMDSGNDTLLFNAVQTFLQLLPPPTNFPSRNNYPLSTNQLSIPQLSTNQLSIPPLSLPCLSIIDFPRFPYRGMHLDVCRHFFSVDEIKKYIDFLAAYKFNNFHWHLTDDQGWRIEIKKYPLLTQVGGCRARTLIGNYGSNRYDENKYCGYYAQEQIKEVVAYAKARYINVIPEIEMPGHALAALAAYPYLGCTKGPYKTMETWGVSEEVFCAGNDSTYQFIENVLAEVMNLFPSQYIHIGGDECPKERWQACPVCAARMSSEKLNDVHALQSYFVKRIGMYLAAKGKKMIGWDEIMEGGLASGATVMSWQGEEGGIAAAKQGHDAIMTPGAYCYFDHAQSANEDSITFGSYLPLEKVYGYEPVPASLSNEEGHHILGAQGNVWTEYITNEQKLEYTIFPRMAALAEVLWSPKANRDWKSFEDRLPAIFAGYKAKDLQYSKAYYDPTVALLPTENNKGILLKVKSKKPGASFYFGNKSKSAFSLLHDSISTVITASGVYSIRALGEMLPGMEGESWGNTVTSPFEYLYKTDLELSLNLATGKKISLANSPSSSYAGHGAFTLVDGIRNTKGMAKSAEFLGFAGNDLEVVIDLGAETVIKEVTLSTFQQKANWIYPPSTVNVYWSADGVTFEGPLALKSGSDDSDPFVRFSTKLPLITNKFIKVIAKNHGIIPPGQPGSGNKAWLFADEIEIF